MDLFRRSAVVALGLVTLCPAAGLRAQESAQGPVIERDWQVVTEVEHNDVQGAGQAASFLTRGTQLTESLLTNTVRRTKDGLDSLVANLRGSNDPRVEPVKASLQQFTYLHKRASTEFRLGDFLASSKNAYVLSRSLKGLDLSTEELWGMRFWGSGGIDKSRWDYLWSKRPEEDKNITVGAFGLGREFGGVLDLSADMAYTNEKRIKDGTPTSKNRVEGMNFDFHPASQFQLTGELAHSLALPDTGGSLDGMAHKYDARLRTGQLRTDLGFERVSPDFTSLSGAATPDKQKWSGRQRWQGPSGWSLSWSHNFYYNDLNGRAGINRTYNNVSQAGVDKRGILGRKSLKAEAQGTYRIQDQKDGGRNDLTTHLGLSDRYGPLQARAVYDVRYVNDRSQGQNDSRLDQVSLNLDSRHTFGDGNVLRPELDASYTMDKNIKANTHNRTWNLGGRLSAEIGQMIEFSAGHNIDPLSREPSDNAIRAVTEAEARLRLGKDGSTSFSLGFKRNRNTFSNSAQNYAENIYSFRWIQKI